MTEFITKLPRGTPSSKSIKDSAVGFAKVMSFGTYYYIPITKKALKVLPLKIRRGKIVCEDFNLEISIDKMLRSFVQAIEIQIRESVGAGVYEDLRVEMNEGLERLYAPHLKLKIKAGMKQKRIGI